MIHGEITKEKLTANDFVKYLQVGEQFVVCFMNDRAEQVVSIPCPSLPEAIQCSELFQMIISQAIQQHEKGLGTEQRIIEDFHRLWYEKAKIQDGIVYPATDALYHGIHTQKNPMDLWIMQEIICETKPDLIIECGTADGGSTLYMANVLDQLDNGSVRSIDILPSNKRPRHPRIEYMTGDTMSRNILDQLDRILESEHRFDDRGRVMVILDDDHSCQHVLEELKVYGELVTKGQYLIVEDTDVNGHPVLTGFGPGPAEAVKEFLKANNDFEVDRTREKFLFTTNPGGYLRRKR